MVVAVRHSRHQYGPSDTPCGPSGTTFRLQVMPGFEEKDTDVVRQSTDTLEDIFCRLQRGELSRRAFVRRATGLGIGGAAAALLARAALAETTIPIAEALANGQARLDGGAPEPNRIEAPRRHNRLGRATGPAAREHDPAQSGQNRPDEP